MRYCDAQPYTDHTEPDFLMTGFHFFWKNNFLEHETTYFNGMDTSKELLVPTVGVERFITPILRAEAFLSSI